MALFTYQDFGVVANESGSRMFGESFQKRADAESILLEQAKAFSSVKSYDIFLSHSSKDAVLILSLKQKLESFGFSVYVDWVDDPQLDRSKVNRSTAETLRLRMKACRGLLYASSHNATNSKWMPWEVGFFDGHKPERVAILPIVETSEKDKPFRGQEYLELYPYIDKDGTYSNPMDIQLWVNYADGRTPTKLRTWRQG